MTDRRHPLPWSIHDGAFTLGGRSTFADHGEDYSLHLGRNGGMEAPLSRAQLQQFRDQIDAVLNAPFRVLIPNPGENDEPWLAGAIRDRLDALHKDHQQIEVALLDADAFESAPEAWAMDNLVPVLIYQTVEHMFTDGGDRVLLVAGPGALELSRQAREQQLTVDLIRQPQEVA